jgi:hypothetical protein
VPDRNLTGHERERVPERAPSPRNFKKESAYWQKARPLTDARSYGEAGSAPERSKDKEWKRKAYDEFIAERRDNTREYIFSLTYLSPQFDPSGLPLAENECEHGRLSGDPTPPCGCFPGEKDPRRRPSSRTSSGVDLCTGTGVGAETVREGDSRGKA